MLETKHHSERSVSLTEIQSRFSAAANSYAHHARIQRQAATQLITWYLNKRIHAQPEICLDIGCGTGFLTEKLLTIYPHSQVHGIDIAPGMLESLKTRIHHPNLRTHLTDGESISPSHLYWPTNSLLISSMCVQWFHNPAQAISRWVENSKVVALSILLDGSFDAWIAAHEEHQLPCGLHPLPTEEEMNSTLAALQAAHPELMISQQTQTLLDYHPDGLSFARSLRAIGADTPHTNHRPVNLRRVIRTLGDGCTINYKIGFYLLQTP